MLHSSLSRLCAGLVLSLAALTTGWLNERAQAQQWSEELLPGTPDWLSTFQFANSDFAFVRVHFSSTIDRQRQRVVRRGAGRLPAGRWMTDWPDADLNLSAQLRRHTTLNVNTEGKVLKLTDSTLAEHPFIYMAEAGSLLLHEDEVTALRQYLLDGGFLMVDDFWGEDEWQRFYMQIKRVFPDREPKELPLEHKVFHCVYDLNEKPLVPAVAFALSGRTTERADAKEAHYRGIFDDRGRMMVLACHNTDLADGWEREDVDANYYREFSAKKAYPMAINIVFFALTQ